jgi:hypothetical protein
MGTDDDTTGSSLNLHEEPRSFMRSRRIVSDVTVLLVVVVFALGITNVVGVRSGDVSAEGGGYELSVHYGTMSRAGLATPFEIEVRSEQGFEGEVLLAVSADYFALFDENGLDPQPASETTLGSWLVWEFDPPPGDTLTVTFDARIEPARQLGASGWVAVLDAEYQPLVEVDFKTRLLP